ncbi:hypothetical protein F4677DRAFT_220402 [Hypoxylon crocopeplum]|nr:hypothetical protein F4677DRAFT_220402 [Hypoxylon crocopeplum]
MSYQLRPTQPPPQQQQQQEGGYDVYNTNGYGYGYSHGQQGYSPLQQQPDMMQAQSLPPSPMPHPLTTYNHDGLARTHTWVANQPSVMSPPPPTKTPFSEWTGPTDSTFDRRTLGAYSATMPPRPPKEDARVLGIKRNHFFIILAVGLFLLVVGIAVGLGVGLGTRKNSNTVATDSAAGDSDAVSSSSSIAPTSTTPTSTTSTTPTSTRVSPTPSFTGTLVSGPVICPQDNNTVYVSEGVSKPFNVQCGRDYSSANGAQDITHMHQSTMANCIDACGKRSDCVGVGWGYYKGSYQCWMKSQLGEPNWSSQWYFAQLQDMGNSS